MADKWGSFEDYQLGPVFQFKAGAAITKGQVVKVSAAGSSLDTIEVSPAINTDNKGIIGTALEDIALGDYGSILTKYKAIAKLTAGGTIAIGDALAADANSKAVTLADQAVNEGGTNTYTIYYAKKFAEALQSAVLNDTFAGGLTG